MRSGGRESLPGTCLKLFQTISPFSSGGYWMLVSHHWRSVYSNYTMYVLYGICYVCIVWYMQYILCMYCMVYAIHIYYVCIVWYMQYLYTMYVLYDMCSTYILSGAHEPPKGQQGASNYMYMQRHLILSGSDTFPIWTFPQVGNLPLWSLCICVK